MKEGCGGIVPYTVDEIIEKIHLKLLPDKLFKLSREEYIKEVIKEWESYRELWDNRI